MNVIKLGLNLKDKYYEKALALGVPAERPEIITVCVDGTKDAVKHGCDLILTDDSRSPGRRELVRITENINEESIDNMCIFKFCRVSETARKLLQCYELVTGCYAGSLSPKPVPYISVVSFRGGVGCTSVAWGIARDLCVSRSKSVLFISGDCFFNLEHSGKLNNEYYKFLYDKYIYGSLKPSDGGGGSNKPALDSLIVKDDYGLAYLNGEVMTDRSIAAEKKKLIFDNIRREWKGEFIVFDLGIPILPDDAFLIKISSAVCLVRSGNDFYGKDAEGIVSVNNVLAEDEENHVVTVDVDNKIRIMEQDFENWDNFSDNENHYLFEDNKIVTIKEDIQSFITSGQSPLSDIRLDGDFGMGLCSINDKLLEDLIKKDRRQA